MSRRTKLVYPNYYTQFNCIADKCQHSCCIGWQIEIDNDTLARYTATDGPFGQRLANNIDTTNKAHFVLKQDGRCPFLNNQGLCDIITTMGEDSLCNICKLHPRFFNNFWGCQEAGLGLCCEEASRIVLNQQQPFDLVNFCLDNYSKKEKRIVKLRQSLIQTMQNRNLSLFQRHSQLFQQLELSMPSSIATAKQLYLGLEILDSQWQTLLNNLANTPLEQLYNDVQLETSLEQLTVYFLYRHLGEAKDYEKAIDMARFSVLSTQMVMWLLHSNQQMSLAEIARMYSAEIEYSTINITKIIEYLHK
ncbi:MAG: flagellin lysine-N-methylase [Clostridia bacterium]|nr:flagellin lysine-N-methylase [Clostridia bacterium]